MKKTIILFLYLVLGFSAFSQQPMERTQIKRDSIGVYRQRIVVVNERLPDTAIILQQIRRMQVEIDTLQSRIKQARQELKDWRKAASGPITPGSSPRSEDQSPANRPTEPGKKKKQGS
jgi:hypothetical protein